MKVRMEACARILHAVPGRNRKIWLVASACIALVAISIRGIGLTDWVNTASVLILMSACFGALKTNVLFDKLRSDARDEEPTQADSERVLLTHLKSVLQTGVSILHANNVVLTLWDGSTGQLLHWNMQCPEGTTALEVTKLEEGLRPRWSGFDSAIYVTKGSAITCLGMGREGSPIPRRELLDYLRLSQHASFETLMLSYFEAGPRWQGTVAYIDAPAPANLDAELSKFQQVAGLAVPVLNLFQRVCASVRMEERRRLARDLHDGVIQSLAATELQIELIERESSVTLERNNRVLDEVRETLHRETRKLRGQMEDLQLGENTGSLKCVFERLLKEFERDTGIMTGFACKVKEGQIPPCFAFDMICLLQEALSNVRKHSGAKRVQVRIEVDGQVHFEVKDDGRGFNFCGRYGLAALQSMPCKPRSLCERVQAKNGDLILESSPGGGVRIEISLPLPSTRHVQEERPYILPRFSGTRSQQVPLKKPPRSVEAAHSRRRVP